MFIITIIIATDPQEAKDVCNDKFHHIVVYLCDRNLLYDFNGQLEEVRTSKDLLRSSLTKQKGEKN